MKRISDLNDPVVAGTLQRGGIGILRTDTLYGIVARADDEAAVSRVYRLKHRNKAKSPIVLIASPQQLFDEPSDDEQKLIHDVWPGKVTVVLASKKAPVWIRRGNNSVAYRLPASPALRQLLETTGPLIAPSANPENSPPAMSIEEAYQYFGDSVDVYIDGGRVNDEAPSQILRIADGQVERLR